MNNAVKAMQTGKIEKFEIWTKFGLVWWKILITDEMDEFSFGKKLIEKEKQADEENTNEKKPLETVKKYKPSHSWGEPIGCLFLKACSPKSFKVKNSED